MNRKLKALGLALFAAFAMSAVAASAASAEDADFWAASGAKTIDHTGDSTQTFSVPGVGNLTCVQKNHLGVETSSLHSTSEYKGESPTQTAEDPEFTNCHATILQFPVTVDTEGCHFTFEAGTMEGSTTANGDVLIDCDENDEITVTVFGKVTGQPTAEGDLLCTLHVTNNQTLEGVTYHNVQSNGKGAVTTTVDTGGIHVFWESAPGCKVEGGGTGTTNAATYKGETLSIATNEDKEQVDTTVTGTP